MSWAKLGYFFGSLSLSSLQLPADLELMCRLDPRKETDAVPFPISTKGSYNVVRRRDRRFSVSELLIITSTHYPSVVPVDTLISW